MGIQENYLEVKSEIEEILVKQGRPKDDVTLICVTKLHDISEIEEAIAAGAKDIGENKVQELLRKIDDLPEDVNKHLIGTLQSNKVKDILGRVKLIHSLDRNSLLKELEKRGKREGIVADTLIQMNISGEETKQGLSEEELEPFLEQIEKCEYVKVRGLMTMAPHTEDPNDVRWVFREMKELFDRLSKRSFKNITMEYLSMGMSNDYLVAVEEGSNMIRVGTKIFGQRDYSKE